ncbi:MAG TPA: hypothetical protein VIY73_28895, partial [Polyangiaceae bacterium]
MRALLVATIVAAIGGVPLGCNVILGTGYVVGGSEAGSQLETGPAEGSVPDGPPAVDACAADAQTKAQLEAVCTTSSCQPFDNASRNTLCQDAGTSCPSVPPYDAGAPEGGGGEAGTPDGGDGGSGLPSCFALAKGPVGGALPQPVVFATGSTA